MSNNPSPSVYRARTGLITRIALTCTAVAMATLVGGTAAGHFDVFTPLLQALHAASKVAA
jgi:hypothetical protein